MYDETVLKIPLNILKVCGLWRPIYWTDSKKSLYTFHTYFIMFILITITLSVLTAVCKMPTSSETFLENVFLMFALINANFKAFNLLIFRGHFIRLLEMVHEKRWIKDDNEEEEKIRSVYTKSIRFVHLFLI